MAKVDGALGSLVQGVSQQPRRARLPGQCQEQINFTADEVRGLSRRPATQHVAYLGQHTNDEFNTVGDGRGGVAVFALNDGTLKNYDYDTGAVVPVNIVEDAAYLSKGNMVFTTIKDDIYVLNKTTQVQKLAGTITTARQSAVVYFLGTQFGRTYTIRFRWTEGGTPQDIEISHVSDKTDPSLITTDTILDALVTAFNGNATLTAAFELVQIEDHLLFRYNNTARTDKFDITVSDSNSGALIRSLQSEIRDVGKLPVKGVHGQVIKVVGGGGVEDDYWLQFQYTPKPGEQAATGTTNDFGEEGVWAECTSPYEDYQLDPATMPHVLKWNTVTNQYDFQRVVWDVRETGDDNSNPFPHFVGTTITDISAFQGRLVVLSEDHVIMSRTNDHKDFFKDSATVNIDTDPIDIFSTAVDAIPTLQYVVPFNRDLVLFAEDRAQFIIFGRSTLTYETASMVLTAAFDIHPTIRPTLSGRNIFYASYSGQFTRMHEFYADGTQDVNDSRPITEHVSRYLSGAPVEMASSQSDNFLVVRTEDDPKTVFVYEYLWLDNQRRQAAWSKWQFGNDVLHMIVRNSEMTVILDDNGVLHMERLRLDRSDTAGLQYQLCLDGYREYVAAGNTITIEYNGDTDDLMFIRGAGTSQLGMRAQVESITLNTAGTATTPATYDVVFRRTLAGNVYVGRRYTSTYTPTMPFYRDRDGVKIGEAKLTVADFILSFRNSGDFYAIQESPYIDEADWWKLHISGRNIGDPNNLTGNPVLVTDTEIFPYGDLADSSQFVIESTSHLPLTLTEIEWRGNLRYRSRRLTNGG